MGYKAALPAIMGACIVLLLAGATGAAETRADANSKYRPGIAPGNVIGTTTYDMQRSAAMADLIAFDPAANLFYIAWMCQTTTSIPGDRGLCYCSFDPIAGIYSSVVRPTDPDYAGYPAVAALSGHSAFGCHVMGPDSLYYLRFYEEQSLLPLYFTSSDLDTELHMLWPQIAVHDAGPAGVTEDVIYVLAHGNPDDDDMLLYRRVGGGEWTSGTYIETTSDISYTIAADPNSDRVAVVYADDRAGLPEGAGGYVDCDTYYRLSEDQGVTWGDPVDISDYTTDSLWRAGSDIAALWTSDGVLHVVWLAREMANPQSYYNHRSRLMHWASDTERASIIDEARYTMTYWNGQCDAGDGNLFLAKASLSECDGNLYVLYTKFGDALEPGALEDCSHAGFASGELYLAGSDDGGFSWDTARNITKTRTPDCVTGDCESDSWASMVGYGMPYGDGTVADTLDIVYINDRDAGPVPYGNGSWTINEVMHYRVPCHLVDHMARINLDPAEIRQSMREDEITTRQVAIHNIGNGTLNTSGITIHYYDSSGWISTDASVPPIPVGGSDTIDVTVDPAGLPPGSLDFPLDYYADIIIESDAVTSPDTISVTLNLFAAAYFCKELTATTKTLRICDNGILGDQTDSASLDIPGDCDADLSAPNGDMYLNLGSPIIAWNDGTTNHAYTALAPIHPVVGDALVRTDGIELFTAPDHEMASYRVRTIDDIFEVFVTILAPTDGNDFMIVIYYFVPLGNPEGLDNVYVGMMVDWNIPSDLDDRDSSGGDEYDSLATIWQRGVQAATDDEDSPHNCPITEDNRYGGIVFDSTYVNAWTRSMQWSFGFGGDSLYEYMTTLSGIDPYTGAGEDSVIDLYSGVTFAQVDMSAGDGYASWAVLLTTNQGKSDYDEQLLAAYDWLWSHGILPLPCRCEPGNAMQGDGINVGDAVYLLNYIFKGGPPPAPYPICSGDANGDCEINIADAVYVIKYIFGGGPAPYTCEQWVNACGMYE